MKYLLLLMLWPALCFGQVHPLTGPPAYPIPGMIQAAVTNTDSGIVIAPTTDTSGSDQVDFLGKGSYSWYAVNLTTASPNTVSLRVATAGPGASVQLWNVNTGQIYGTVNLPNTGGLSQWQTVSVSMNLPAAGYSTLGVLSTAATLWDLNWMDFEFPTMPPPSQAQAVPGMIQAESYFNSNGPVATHATSDFGKGLDVGRVGEGDYMDYYINVPTGGLYTISMRLASDADSATFRIDDVLGDLTFASGVVPNTGGFQKWRTINVTGYLDQGLQIIRLTGTSKAKWNINWLFFVQGFQSTGYQTIPGLIQAEWFIFESGVGTEPTSEGGYDVGWIDKNDWMNYNVVVNGAGTYMANFQIATIDAHASFKMYSNDGSVLATVHLPNTGGYQSWSTVSVPVTLKAGVDTFWIVSTSDSHWNIHYMQYTAVTDTTSTVPGVSNGAATSFADSSAMAAASTRLWPNPVRDLFTIQLSDGYSGTMAIQVMDASGVIRQTTNIVKAPGVNQVTLNASGLATGIYYVRIIGSSRQEVIPLFKL